ncbi:PEP/pyruvate-binding domain-containing protein [Mediterraneibacter glycyrrhizinilyticus]|uniref:PEP/pyruvate-binding domain-containing protein n=1 Tax=Mediterraneibacter glycyrrhizinilyticus TaxID=342942 RepID=UPI0025A3767F|nr:PEP/pyruvate-binding domain-containing protein [Mediterraneibacter glycyrrhizinilyticus]MDM8124336.1 PEP/pyruvate-binding domain-containing protein [Mediterraneibacter glycyrrhizinilyticus]
MAYFPLLRGRHSFEAVARIRDTTQLLLDVYRGGRIYPHPLKVWNRYSTKMFLPHSCSLQQEEEYRFETVDGGVAMSRYYRLVKEEEEKNQDQNYDSHDRFFSLAKLDYQRGIFNGETERQIIESTLTKDRRLQEMIRKYFRPRDYFQLRDRMVGSGSLGGKACGMLLARKIIHTELPEYRKYFEPHDSFYIGSDVFYTYIVSNNCWETRIGQRTEEGYFTKAEALKDALLSGTFPPDIREKFRNLLEYFGQSPIIVRSSSFLEDGFGNAFAGKYESVFCVDQGSPEERLEAFEAAVRTVYASTMDISALEYRKQRGLQHSDEQMAVPMQNSVADRHRFSQRIMDVLDTEKNELTETEIDSMLENLPLWYKKAVMERDYEAEAALKRMNRPRQVWFTTCQGLLENREFTELMQKMLKTLDRVYGNPVDIEYTVNLDEQGEFVVNLLQCRPLYTGGRGTVTEIPELPEKNVFFRLKDSAMGNSVKEKIDVVVQIDARAYYEYPYALKPQSAEAVGAINTYYKGKKKHILLMTPGRVGTSSPELGVPVSFAQISGFCGICEVSDNRAGYMPELSYGSHMFQDLVEAGIFYCALWGDERTVKYNEAFFGDLENLFPVICPERKEMAEIFRVSEPEDLWYWNNEQTGETVCGILHERIG